MAEQPCLGSVDLPTLASCDPLNHYLACPPSACMEASKPTLLPAGQYTFLLVGVCATLFVQLCLCAILCQSVSRPSEVVVTYGLRAVWKNLLGHRRQPITGWAIACECAVLACPTFSPPASTDFLNQKFSAYCSFHFKCLRLQQNIVVLLCL